MSTFRVIPCLLLQGKGLVKTVNFKNPKYVGDPRNTVKIFNDKEVDELVLLDIGATNEERSPNLALIGEIVSEAFMPVGYGGGIRTLDEIRTILNLGVEKVVINSRAIAEPALVSGAAELVGSQSVVVSLDVARRRDGSWRVFTHGARRDSGLDVVALAADMERRGAGELMINSIDRDGTMTGYDLELVRAVTRAVSIPVIACGGAATVGDLTRAIAEGGASAAAAGSMFVFHGKHRAVLITYPSRQTIKQHFSGGA